MGELFVVGLSFKLGKVFILVVRFIPNDSPPQKKKKKKKKKDVGILQNTSWRLFYFKHWYMYEKAF